MDKPSCSGEKGRTRPQRNLDPHDPKFGDYIRSLIHDELQDEQESDSSEVDDSDQDPDYVLPDQRQLTPHFSSEDDEDVADEDMDGILLEEDGNRIEVVVNQNIEEDVFYVERTKKTEVTVPNAWSSKPPPRSTRTPARNIIRMLPGVKGRARLLGNQPSKTDVWELLFDHEIMTIILENTNTKLESVRAGLSETTKKKQLHKH